jgi:hypothetical protein
MIRLPLTFLLALMPCLAAAQSFDGAYVSAEALAYSSERDMGQLTYSGGAQVSFGPGILASADLTFYGFETLEGDASSATLHSAYWITPDTAVGAFLGRDSSGGSDGAFYGIEGRTSFSVAAIEGFLGQSDGTMTDGLMYGLSGQFSFAGLEMTAGYAGIGGDDATDHLSLTGAWRLGPGPSLYAEFGTLSGAVDDDYIALGIRLGIGQNGGTTFGPRSVFEIAPGL